MSVEVLLCVLIAREYVEVVAIDLDVSANWHVSGCDKLLILVYVLVLPALEELPFHDARVLLGWLINGDRII